jgi:RimJ/RimL family protein N-acetyltransferase
VTDVSPLAGLRLRTPRLELRLGSHDEVVELGRLAENGIHPPDEMPFVLAWTDRVGEPGFLDAFIAFHESAQSSWSPDDWSLLLLVWLAGTLVGTQELAATRYAEERRVSTHSWVGARYQGRGVGTEMRAAVLELAFARLGAVVATSTWLEGNEASRRVSAKLGYRTAGITTATPRGEPVPLHEMAIASDMWRSPFEVEIDGLEPCVPLFGLSAGPAAPS